jgi:ElaB/YqjD/DUF883 family membrane-anchored ribosome-binding protein
MKSEDIKSVAKDIGDSTAKGSEEAKKSFQDNAAQASDMASDLYGRAKDTVKSVTDGLPDSASEALASGKRVYQDGTDQLVRQIAKQPLEALLLAGAIGYLVGWATSRS